MGAPTRDDFLTSCGSFLETFWYGFFDFSEMAKTLKLATLTTLWKLLRLKANHCSIPFSLIFHVLFQNPFWSAFLAPKTPIYTPKVDL
jgi:hypothetical protein